MRWLRKKSLMILCIIVILGGFSGYVIYHSVYLSTKKLNVGETEDEGDGIYIIRIYDENGVSITLLEITRAPSFFEYVLKSFSLQSKTVNTCACSYLKRRN